MSETNDSTFCEDGDHFKIVREGSRYQELKAEVEKANQKRCTCSGFAVQYDGCSCENGKAEYVALDRLHEFERGSAELIERSHDELKKWCEDFCKNTPCSDCQTRKLIDEIEALKGGEA